VAAELFQTRVLLDDVASTLSIRLDASHNPATLLFVMEAEGKGKAASKSLEVRFDDIDGLDAATFGYDTLDRTYTLAIALKDQHGNDLPYAKQLANGGVGGASLGVDAELRSLTLILRPRPSGGDWTSERPSFSIVACWDIEGKASTSWQDGGGAGQVGAAAVLEACIGLSIVVPDSIDLGLPNIQVRLDLPSIGLSTEWVPWDWFELPAITPLSMPGLLAWFSDLVEFDWATELPGVTVPALPAWNVDLPLSMDLPLGIGVKTARLYLRKQAKTLVVDAVAEGFYLTWQGELIADDFGYIAMHYDQATGEYSIEVRFFEAQYPAMGTEAGQPFGFSLPFDLLGLEADCWYFRLGLFLGNAGGGSPRACFEALLEIGGLRVTSRFTGDGEDGLYQTDLRLLLRDTTIMAAELTSGAPEFFAGAKSNGQDAFAAWRGKPIPALSFARDLRAPPPAGADNEYGITFVDGDFRKGERAYLLWQMSGQRLLKALAHDLLGREPAGKVAAGEAMTDFALECSSHDGGATQIRLDWRPTGAMPGPLPNSGAPAARTGNGKCLVGDEKAVAPVDLTAFNLPFASPGTYLDGNFEDPLSFDLPAISLEVARPATQSIVLRAEPDGTHSASHLLLFPGTQPGPADKPVPPLARARIGFSLKETTHEREERSVVETKDQETKPFITIGLANVAAGDFAVRTVGWRRGRTPRFLEVLPDRAGRVAPLIPQAMPKPAEIDYNNDPGCPGTRPAPLPAAAFDFDAFETPRFSGDAWRLSVRVAAEDALFKMFDGPESAGQRVSFKIKDICIHDQDERIVELKTELTFTLGSGADAFNATGDVTFLFDLRDMALTIADGASLAFTMKMDNTAPEWTADVPLPDGPKGYFYSEEMPLLGLKMTALSTRSKDDKETSRKVDILTLSIKGGRFVLALSPECAIVLRYTGLGRGSLNFWVTEFVLGPGGLDATGSLIATTLRVKGLKSPFLLEQATLRIRSSRLEYLSISGSGVLPELLDEAPVKISMAFRQNDDRTIELDSLDAQLGDKGKPIFSRGTRFKFEIEELGLAYKAAPDGGERHFFFELTGSAQFTPDTGEFNSGLLENLKSARLDFVRVPLTDEFAEHISLSIELKRPVVFSVFGIFKMEIRSFGFHPKFPDFEVPTAALIIGGQMEFADTGDVVRAEIDFHAMYLGLPKPDSAIPQIYFDKLRVDISTDEGFRIGGRVDTYKGSLREGFAGEGTVQIPGFPELSAAFGFVRVREKPEDPWQRAWFIGVDVSKISYQVGGALPIYLRQIGMGFGYRYTLPMIAEFEKYETLSELIEAMLKAVDKHSTLAEIDSWQVETDGRRWTIALEALLSLGSANSSPFDYNRKAEREIRTIFTQILAAYRSDFTLVAAAKLWFPVSVDDFFENEENMRERPLATGFFAFSAAQNRLLAHVRKNQDPYLGSDKDQPIPYLLKLALEKSYFEATLLIEPGLVHAELGWPDRLGFDLAVGPMKVGCRAGILMRLERDMLIYGYYFSAYGELNLGGGVDFGFVGVRVEALVRIQYATRLLIGANTRQPLASNIYGAIGLDIAVRFLVRAWLRLEFRFFTISIDISFSFDLQLSVLGEIGWAGQGELGFRGQAQFVIGVFGRSLGVKIDVGVNKGAIDKAKSVLQQYAGSFLEPGQAPPAMPGIDDGLRRRASLDNDAKFATTRLFGRALNASARFGEDLRDAFVTASAEGEIPCPDGDTLFFAWIMPGPGGARFYVPPVSDQAGGDWQHYADLKLPEELFKDASIFALEGGAWRAATSAQNLQFNRAAHVNLVSQDNPGAGDKKLSLDQLIAGCYIPHFAGTPDAAVVEDFPSNWPIAGASLGVAHPDKPGDRLHDPRVFDPSDAARGPRRMLDQTNGFDRAIMNSFDPAELDARAAETGDDKNDVYLREQALANQSLLLQGFYDDLTRIARTTGFANDLPVTPSLGTGRPSLRDLGMLVCVKAKTMPDWLSSRDAKDYPTIEFINAKDVDAAGEVHALKPAADADCVNFASNPPVVRDAAGYFDEEVVALAWRLDWGGTPPTAGKELAVGATADIEYFLRNYEITFVDFATQRVIHRTTAKPCDVVSKMDGKDVRLSRYSYSVARDKILPREATTSNRRVVATITPVSQAGTRGASFSISLTLTPVMTPLAADDAGLDLCHTQKQGWRASLRWRQPRLPEIAGVARTAGWQLILRPLADVPLGAYPEEAADDTERGLMSATGQALIEGDIVVPLVEGKDAASPFTYVLDENEELPETAERAPAEKRLRFDFTMPAENAVAPFFDHEGRRLDPNSSLHRAAFGFFRRTPASESTGRAWRLYLRAVTVLDAIDDDTAILAAAPVSGLSPVRLAMSIPIDRHTSATPDTAKPRPLAHFEWPSAIAVDDEARTMAHGDFNADADLLHIPVIDDRGGISFVAKPGRERAVTITWNAVPSKQVAPLAAIAAYTVHENNLDGLINFDLANLGARANRLRRIIPTDPAKARLIPSGMADTQNWEAQYPVFARIRGHLEHVLVPTEEMLERWPGTYSWAESELEWPDQLEAEHLEQLRGHDILRDLLKTGEGIAPGRVHPYLVLLLAMMRDLGSPEERRFQVEVSAGPPPVVVDPVKWLDVNNSQLDPYGWASLSVLGLATVFALRDPVTGILMDQGVVAERINRARARLAKLFDDFAASVPAAVLLSKIANAHVMVEQPLQHAQAYRASSGDTADVEDIGLAIVQVSLRPVPRQFAYYDIIRVKEALANEAVVTIDSPVDIIFAERDKPALALKAGSTLDLRMAINPGEKLIVREFQQGRFRELLKGFFEICGTNPEIDELAKRPVEQFAQGAFEQRGLLAAFPLTPYGRFERLPGVQEARAAGLSVGLVPPGFSEPRFALWIDYLAEAFARPAPGDDAADARNKAVKALSDKLSADDKLFDAYRRWADRMFATAPISVLHDSLGNPVAADGLAKDAASTQPKSVEPVQIAVDGRGKLRMTRFIKAEWATARSYSVSYEGRYDRLSRAFLRNPLSRPEDKEKYEKAPPLPAAAARRDVFLPRVRSLEPPVVLSARSLRAADGRPFNEIVVTHSELRLLESNTEVAAKLEFGDLRRSYERAFSLPDYVSLLKAVQLPDGTKLLDGAELSRAVTIDGAWDDMAAAPDLIEHDQTLLYAAPAARWGATRYQDAAEPFYYRQTVTIEAVASRTLMTEGHSVVMPSAAPDRLTPLGRDHSAAAPVVVNALAWAKFWPPMGLTGLWTGTESQVRATRFDDWSAELRVPDDLKKKLIGLMRPAGFAIDARLPRYAESLATAMRDGPFAHELKVTKGTAPAGLLPDAGVRLLFADLAPGQTVSAIAQIAPRQVPPVKVPVAPSDVFVATTLSSDFETMFDDVSSYPGATWTDGLFAHARIRPRFEVGAVDCNSGLHLEGIHTLVDLKAETLLADGQLQNAGPLARLAPLAMRLVVEKQSKNPNDIRIGLASPLAAPRWAFRPSLDPESAAGQAPASADDLFIGLRLLLDADRRRAAGLVAPDQESAQSARADFGLLEKIERAALATDLPRNVADERTQIFRLIESGFEVFERITADSVWRRVKEDVMEPGGYKIALFMAYSDDRPPVYVDNALFAYFGKVGHAVDKEQHLRQALDALAHAAYRRTGMREPRVFAQRGNEPPVAWQEGT
jgi:hypothetical protein